MINLNIYLKELIEKPKDKAIKIVVPLKELCKCNCHTDKHPYKKDIHYDGIERVDKLCNCKIGGLKIKKGQTLILKRREGFWYAGVPAQLVTKIKIKILDIKPKDINDFTEEEVKELTINLNSAQEGILGGEMLNAPETHKYREGLKAYVSKILKVKNGEEIAVLEVM